MYIYTVDRLDGLYIHMYTYIYIPMYTYICTYIRWIDQMGCILDQSNDCDRVCMCV